MPRESVKSPAQQARPRQRPPVGEHQRRKARCDRADQPDLEGPEKILRTRPEKEQHGHRAERRDGPDSLSPVYVDEETSQQVEGDAKRPICAVVTEPDQVEE
jgi:hypothetical protein